MVPLAAGISDTTPKPRFSGSTAVAEASRMAVLAPNALLKVMRARSLSVPALPRVSTCTPTSGPLALVLPMVARTVFWSGV